MPEFEFEFNQQDKDLVVSQNVGTFSETDYIRLTIYPTEAINNVVDLPNSDNGIDGKAIFFSTLSVSTININISPFKEDNKFDTKPIGGVENDFKIYQTLDDDGEPLDNSSIYIKPNEIFNEFELPQGDYKIQIDFLSQVTPNSDEEPYYKFIIKQISTSRKEVRLKILDEPILNNSDVITNLTNELNQNTDKYQFKHILNIGTGDHIPIMNYAFDAVTDGKDNQSIILKLYEPLPTNVGNLSMVTIEREVLTTQTQDIFYFSDVPDVFFGDGLPSDAQENWINPDGNDIGFQSLDEIAISSSIGDIELDSLISSSEYGYPNLNTDFREFTNHTFFGSAKKKLENFKTKVETIQGYYSDISGSLSANGGAIDGDSTFLVQKRKNLFDKITKEVKNLTPYEKFLYNDAQSESTASAPSLKNYADVIPVQLGGNSVEGIELNQHNGFNVVYKHTSEKVSGTHNKYIDLFTDKYKVQDKPFFNYSGSVYLSFLLQGDSGSALTWGKYGQTTTGNGLGVPLSKDALHQNRILNPLITGSEYRRFIYEASQSYWIPNQGIDFMDLPTVNGDGEFIDSNNITFLHTNIKTGSYQVKDSTGKYPTTVVTQSGAPFKGSCMPAGELFRIYNQNTLSSSLQGYWNIDDVTSGSGLVDADVVNGAGPTFGDGEVNKQVSASSGVTSRGRTYGSSYFMISESSADTGIQIESSNYNFNKDDNFSLSIWAKRSHPTSIDPVDGNVQGIFTRGVTNDSYGIDYNFFSGSGNKIRAGVRPGASSGTKRVVEFAMTDSGSNWHHYVMTYESASATGIKLYVDGVLRGSTTNITDGTGAAMGDFSSSAVNTSDEKLTIGGNDVISGNGRQFNGFLQYPRVYTRTITPSEVNQLFLHPDGITETKITDVKVTLKNPSNVLPFDNVFKTTSNSWTTWYNNALTQAENFDTDNIHSFENNLPLYIQESSDYNEMKDFLNLQGEQYDLIRNHIDSMGTIHKRGYKKTNSPPDNTLPMLLNNMGWETINPFEGDLTETLGSYLSGVTSIDDIKNNTWRKTLNNLLYIYKSKGTKNSVRALLNTYGYPPDVLNFQEFGGVVESSNNGGDNPLNNDVVPASINIDTDLDLSTGGFNFTKNKEKFYRYRFAGKQNRILNLDWWMDSANIDTFEFVYKHDKTTQTQTILESSGSNTQSLWDLRLVPSSDGASSSFQFRLNNSLTGSGLISLNAVSMSTNYSKISDGQLWNVMLQRMTSSTSTNITNEYRLHSSLQDGKTIKTYNYVTMSVSGGISIDSNNLANQNWFSTGSRHPLSSSNLFVGETLTGSLGEIRGWSTALSTSKFRQHTFNKFSIVGNSITSHCKELIYHFKLNENYGQQSDTISGSGVVHSISSSTQNMQIVDSAHEFGNYNLTKQAHIFLTSSVYGFDLIDTVQPTLQDNISLQNDNNIVINPNNIIVGNLNPNQSAVLPLTDKSSGKPILNTSPKLELYRSPQNFVNDFIIDKIGGFNLEKKYGNPLNFYSQSYDEFDTFREEFFDCYDIKIDVNKFVRSHESMFNHSLSEGLKQVVPARSTFSDKNSNFGVEIKPTILEKQKYENEKHSVETNPNTGIGTIDVDSITYVPSSNYETIKEGTANVNITNTSTHEQPKSASISVNVTNTTTYELPKSSSISPLPTLNNSSVPTSKDGTFDYASIANESYTSVHKNWGRTNNDVQHINFAAPTASDGTFNTYHIDTRVVFHAIGDHEYYSSSADFRGTDDFSNSGKFYNRLMIDTDFHADVTYDGKNFGSGTGIVTGRMMGKTRYFSTGSDGNIILPSNHITKFSYPFKERMNSGAQNTKPGKLNVKQEDYSVDSFYVVKVTGGETSIYVKGTSNPTKDNNDNIIY